MRINNKSLLLLLLIINNNNNNNNNDLLTDPLGGSSLYNYSLFNYAPNAKGHPV